MEDRAPESRRVGQIQLTTKLLAGVLGIDGGLILAVTQTGDERLEGKFRIIVQSDKLAEVPEGATPPIIPLELVQ